MIPYAVQQQPYILSVHRSQLLPTLLVSVCLPNWFAAKDETSKVIFMHSTALDLSFRITI